VRTARAEGFRAGGSGPRCGTVAVEQALGVRVGPGLGLGGARGRAFTNSLNGTGRCLSRVSVVRLPTAVHCPAKQIGRSSDSSSAARSPRGAHLPAYRRAAAASAEHAPRHFISNDGSRKIAAHPPCGRRSVRSGRRPHRVRAAPAHAVSRRQPHPAARSTGASDFTVCREQV